MLPTTFHPLNHVEQGSRSTLSIRFVVEVVLFHPVKEKNTLLVQFIRLFRYACPSSSFRCSRKRPSLLSLACASGRLSLAVGERYYYCVYFL